jgi:hypothetical protein
MLEKFQSANSRDFRQRYEGTFGYFTNPVTKSKKLVKLTGVGDTSVSFTDKEGVKYEAVADRDLEFEFIPLERKLFLSGGHLMYVERKPARQWSRGVCDNNTRITNLSTNIPVAVNFDRIQRSMEPVPDLYTQMQKIKNKSAKSVLFNSFLGVHNDTLFLYGQAIGEADLETKTLKIREPLFLQEVLDSVRDTGHIFTVEVING